MSTERARPFDDLFAKKGLAKKCFPTPYPLDGSRQVKVNHKGKDPADVTPAAEFFTGEGFKTEFVDQMFYDDGSWEYKDQDPKSFDGLTLDQVNTRLCSVVQEIYELANGSLDKIDTEKGFNRHDTEHIRSVLRGALVAIRPYIDHLIDTENGSHENAKQVLFELLCAVWGHDLGNILSRSLHSLISADMLERIFPTLYQDHAGNEQNNRRLRVRRAIMLHNEPVALDTIASWKLSGSAQIIEKMREKFGPVALALIIGDKIDIGRHRISKKPNSTEVVEKDEHLQVNLYLDSRGIEFIQNGQDATWSIDFTPAMSQEDQTRYKPFSLQKTNGDYQAWIPERARTEHHEHNSPHIFYAESLFWKLYWSRIKLSILSLFALHPDLDTFTISIRDGKDGAEALSSSNTTFRRSILDEQFATIEKKFSLVKKATR